MATLNEILTDKNNRLESVPLDFEKSATKSQDPFLDSIIALLDDLEKKDGVIVQNVANLAIVDQIVDQLRTTLNQSGYLQAVASFADEFDTQKIVNDDYFKKIVDTFEDVPLATGFYNRQKREAVNFLIGAGVEPTIITPIRTLLDDAVMTGASLSETIGGLRLFVSGDPTKDGILQGYAKQIAYDSFAISDRTYTNTISTELGLDWFFYSGGVLEQIFNSKGNQIGGTREFCFVRDGNHYHRKEMELWTTKEGEPKPANEWGGMIPTTDSQTIFINLGGYRCQHSAMPVSAIVVPKDVLIRNLESGNFKPSAKERGLLGI